jgi:1-deoxy-D-xylulose-5-phosphate synthase
MDEAELRNLMYTASKVGEPFVIRYPRGCGPGVEWRGKEFEEVQIGKGRCLRSITDHPVRYAATPPQEGNYPLALLSFGPVGNFVSQAIEKISAGGGRNAAGGVSVAHYDLRFAKPLDEDLLHEVGKNFKRVITVEDGVIRGGVGSAVEDFFSRHGYGVRVEKLGIPDEFIPHGTPGELYALCGFDADGIFNTITKK